MPAAVCVSLCEETCHPAIAVLVSVVVTDGRDQLAARWPWAAWFSRLVIGAKRISALPIFRIVLLRLLVARPVVAVVPGDFPFE